MIETIIILGISCVIVVLILILNKLKISDSLVGLLVGSLFGLGLVISGMVKRTVVVGFLNLNKDWNPSLAFVLGFAVAPNIITFYLMRNHTEKPVLAEKYSIPTNKTIDLKLVSGGVLFGIGWGLGGMCPGPVFCNLVTLNT